MLIKRSCVTIYSTTHLFITSGKDHTAELEGQGNHTDNRYKYVGL